MIEPTGSLFGAGDIAVDIANAGQLGPGLSPGRLDIGGDYTQLATGQLLIELAGLDYDQLFVAGTASLDGRLDVTLYETFQPTAGDVCDILVADQILGEFSQTFLPLIDPLLAWRPEYLLDAASDDVLRLSVRAVPLPAAAWFFVAALASLGLMRRRASVPRHA